MTTLADKAREALEMIGHHDWVFDPENVGKSTDWCWQLRTEYNGTPIYVVCQDRYAKGPGSNDSIARAVASFPDLARAVIAAEALADAVHDWDVAVNAGTDAANEADEMLRALAAYCKATENEQ